MPIGALPLDRLQKGISSSGGKYLSLLSGLNGWSSTSATAGAASTSALNLAKSSLRASSNSSDQGVPPTDQALPCSNSSDQGVSPIDQALPPMDSAIASTMPPRARSR